MNEAERIATEACGCRYDRGTGTVTHYCAVHHPTDTEREHGNEPEQKQQRIVRLRAGPVGWERWDTFAQEWQALPCTLSGASVRQLRAHYEGYRIQWVPGPGRA
ncbi:MAG TPA: hypothetical protein VNL98_06740 [Gemmatimonadales bacterium]|nr:hypothetical protein [Gemmatimonadales bacterium]